MAPSGGAPRQVVSRVVLRPCWVGAEWHAGGTGYVRVGSDGPVRDHEVAGCVLDLIVCPGSRGGGHIGSAGRGHFVVVGVCHAMGRGGSGRWCGHSGARRSVLFWAAAADASALGLVSAVGVLLLGPGGGSIAGGPVEASGAAPGTRVPSASARAVGGGSALRVAARARFLAGPVGAGARLQRADDGKGRGACGRRRGGRSSRSGARPVGVGVTSGAVATEAPGGWWCGNGTAVGGILCCTCLLYTSPSPRDAS